MSRTFKDTPTALRWTNGRFRTWTDYWQHKWSGEDLPKQKKNMPKWHWVQRTPSNWTRIMMNRPKRRAVKLWEQQVKNSTDLDNVNDCPDYHAHKPHVFYY